MDQHYTLRHMQLNFVLGRFVICDNVGVVTLHYTLSTGLLLYNPYRYITAPESGNV